ncbi:MAG TPA: hypothetical protein VNA69_19725 [Thermoanaerobaculia bacterium]|nr:hypothetical protein [Thermoanaerobaculia bacterium]
MSIAARIDDARLLWEAGRREGAFLSVLVAVAAASRTKYPNVKSDREAFERFVAESFRISLSVEFRGQLHSIEHVLYKWLRCELVHEGAVPFDITFMEEAEPGSMSVRAGGPPENVLKLGHGWFDHLSRAALRVVEP